MKIYLLLCGLLTFGLPLYSSAEDAPANSELVVDDAFDNAELGKGWSVNTGDWKIVDGVLRVKELEQDKHSAAARHVIETGNATYQLRFRFVEEGKTLHFGFDPKKGELKKRGHLFSVVINRDSWQILKHVDKDRPKEEPNEVLAKQTANFEVGTWHTLNVTTLGDTVTAHIDGKEPLTGSHPSFTVAKPTLVFRCIGDGVEIDDLKVWKQAK